MSCKVWHGKEVLGLLHGMGITPDTFTLLQVHSLFTFLFFHLQFPFALFSVLPGCTQVYLIVSILLFIQCLLTPTKKD